ncbi:hypothetical protein [Microbacterium laevaniformans]|uniref:hypothetical protein n=1 Tax=Microbacterium laevaniformans TaxID=36807 RepID=UPI003D98A0E9
MKKQRPTRSYTRADGTRVSGYDSRRDVATPTHAAATPPVDNGWDSSVDRSAYATTELRPAQVDALIAGRNPAALVHVAERRNLTREHQFRIADDREMVVRHALASNPGARPDVLDQLSRDADVRVRAAALENPTCPAGALRDAYRSALEDVELKATAVAHENADAAFIRAAASDPDPVLRSTAIGRWDAPADVLALAANGDNLDRLCVAENPGAGSQLMSQLSKSAEPEIRAACAGNLLALDDETLARLETDDDARVRAVAAHSRRILDAIDERLGAA